MSNEKYRVHELVQYSYSDIGQYVDDKHTDKPLRNDELVKLLNGQDEKIKELMECNRSLAQKQIRFVGVLKENDELKDKNNELKKLWDYLKPFQNLARDYNLSFEQLYEITSNAIEKKD